MLKCQVEKRRKGRGGGRIESMGKDRKEIGVREEMGQ